MIPSISWRNIWRNKLRSAIILIAIAIGIFAGVFTWAFYQGMVEQRVNNAIMTEVSNIQIHRPGYLKDPEIKADIQDPGKIISVTDTMQGVKAVSARILANGMALSAETGAGVKMTGVDPEQEKKVTNLYEKIVDGAYFEGINRNPVVIGHKLAEKLNVKVRSKLVITLQTIDGDITSAQFRIAGIYRTSNSMYDESNIFVRKGDLSKLLGFEKPVAHEIAILLDNNNELDQVYSELKNTFPGQDIQTWRKLMPEVSLVEETVNVSMYFIMGIILAALCFGIINTMLMAVLERVKELGMLMAVGMNKRRVFSMIVLETVMLSILGGVLGMVIAWLATVYYSSAGIDLSKWAQAYAKLGFDTMIYPVLDYSIIVKVAVMVIITGIIGSIYPAIKALKLNPADAIRTDM